MPSTATNEFIFNGGHFSPGGFTDTLGILSITDNSAINLKYLPIHSLTFSGKGSFVNGKKLIIYGWSGLTAPALTKNGQLLSSNPTQLTIYLRSSGSIGTSKSGGITQFGQVVSASLGTDFNGRIYFSNSTSLSSFQLNRINFYVDSSASYTSPYNYFSAAQKAGSFELIAFDTLKVEPIDLNPTSTLAVTTAANLITNVSATSGGNITAAANDAVIARGVVWSTSANPTVDLSTKTIDGAGTGTFTSNITGLTAGTLYYVRSYATNSHTTDYGAQTSFTTQTPPTLTSTTTPSSVTASSASSGGNISSANGFTMQTRGVVWSTSPNPTIALSTKTAETSNAIGTFTSNITGLSGSTLYYVRSYATNTSGTDYGPQITFTTAYAPNGSSIATAATSAKAIKDAYPTSTDGLYYINLPTVGVQQVYCLMDNKYDGGGWMLALKAPATGSTFNYDANYWTTTNNLNIASPSRLSTSNTDAKYDVMNYYAIGNDLMALWPDIPNSPSANGSTNNSGSISGLTEWSWLAKSILGGNTTMLTKLNSPQQSLITNPAGVASGSGTTTVFNFTGFGAGTYYPFTNQAGFSFYGFNYTGNAYKARWGFGWNNEADQGSNDVSGGIGLNRTAWSAGDSYGCCEGLYVGLKTQRKIEVYVR
jgi:hypothetical protein